MKLLKNQFVIVLILMTTMNCKNQEIDTLAEYIKKIDSAPLTKSFYIIEVDSNKNPVDTIALRKLKYNAENNLIFENNFQLEQHLETVNYYNDKNEMIYSEIKKDGEVISDFRVNLKNDLIISANYNVYGNGKTDSVFMEYDYIFENGKKKKLLINSGDGFNTIELYDQLEKPILNFAMHKKDTLEKTEFLYDRDNTIDKKRIKNFLLQETTIYEYDDGLIMKESFIVNGIEKFQIEYYEDEQGNFLNYTKKIVKDSI